jgi:hypothetical protein
MFLLLILVEFLLTFQELDKGLFDYVMIIIIHAELWNILLL